MHLTSSIFSTIRPARLASSPSSTTAAAVGSKGAAVQHRPTTNAQPAAVIRIRRASTAALSERCLDRHTASNCALLHAKSSSIP